MDLHEIKLYLEDGQYLGTLGDIQDDIVKYYNIGLFGISENEECPISNREEIKCDECNFNKICNSFQKEKAP